MPSFMRNFASIRRFVRSFKIATSDWFFESWLNAQTVPVVPEEHINGTEDVWKAGEHFVPQLVGLVREVFIRFNIWPNITKSPHREGYVGYMGPPPMIVQFFVTYKS